MNIVLIVPYFGKLPEWITLFFKSCEYLDGKIDFLFFTDDENKIANNLMRKVKIKENIKDNKIKKKNNVEFE